MLFKKIFIFILLVLFSFSASANTPRSTGKYKNWESFTAQTDKGKICFAQTIPTKRAPASIKREKSKLFNNTRLYFTAKNPLILKKFSGYTPELPGDPMGLAGVELDAYPTLSSYYIGIKMSL